jgi:hypothetical protein
MPGPYNFVSQWKTARNLLLSASSQAAWNTAFATPLTYLTQAQRFDGNAILELIESRRSDIDYAGKGTAFATNGQITSYDTKFSGFKAELSPWLAGWLLGFLMGTDTVTGDAAPYTHTFAFDETTRTAVPTTIYLEDTEAIKYMCPDMCIDEVTFTINDIGAIMAEMTMMGTGRQVMGALSPLPAVPAETYMLGSDAVLTWGPVGSGVSIVGRHMTTTFKLQNQLIVHKAPGGGLYGIFVRKGNPKFSVSTTIACKDTDDTYTLFENNTASVFSLAVNSGSDAQMTIDLPSANFKTAKLGFDGDMTVYQLETDETSCYEVDGAPPVSVSVTNAVAAYLVAA